ncbi:hypothetical protein [Luteimonas terricola]|uniref:MarR family transcriptional regulator n=1 Tax=Luteimonas terricola TaxID=645597 RepID=A0ABQ2EE54_9GAMM|nr:hypothetical protein [Luteimonas terricola]GGK08750.1 hypothetical protein GCM10011394_17700 [Luteimonas terricola]
MSQQTIPTRLLFALAGHSRNGLRLKPLSEAIEESPGTTLRNLQRMEEDGLTERTPQDKDNWRLSARVVQIAIAHSEEVLREEQQLAEFKNRYSRTPA